MDSLSDSTIVVVLLQLSQLCNSQFIKKKKILVHFIFHSSFQYIPLINNSQVTMRINIADIQQLGCDVFHNGPGVSMDVHPTVFLLNG